MINLYKNAYAFKNPCILSQAFYKKFIIILKWSKGEMIGMLWVQMNIHVCVQYATIYWY